MPNSDTLELNVAHRPFGPDEVLLYYDGPVLMWLDTPQERYLAVSLPDDGGRWPFLLVGLSSKEQQQLESGALTLRRAYTNAVAVWLLPDYDAEVLLAHRLEEVPEHWLPGDVGLTP
jgi:hypothetical protein